MAEAMSDTRLAQLAGLAELSCNCGLPDCEIYMSGLTRDQAQDLAAEAKRARDELAEMRACHEQTHVDNGKLHAFIAELTTAPAQWRLIAPDGGRQIFPRKAIQGGAPWPDGWRIETRDVRYGEWKPAEQQPKDGDRG